MKAQTAPIPPDVAAYLIAAATDLAKEQDFQPDSERSLRTWMEANHVGIGQRAKDKMDRLRDMLLGGGEQVEVIKEALSKEVYNRIPKPAQPKWNPRYVAYAAENGCTPEEMLKRDGNMVNFICWAHHSNR